MRHVQSFVTCGFIAAIAMIVHAAEKPSADYQKAMKDLGGIVGALTKPGASEDFELAKQASITAKDAFGVAEKYWSTRGDAEAVKLAKAGAKAALDLNVVAGLSSPEGVEAAMKDMTETCTPCHTAHREKAEDGSFQIK